MYIAQDHGIFGTHEGGSEGSLPVAAVTGKEFNALRDGLSPIACAQLPGGHFEFTSSFVKPEVGDALTSLARLRKLHPGAPLAVFGHADPSGEDSFNKKLSGRRARAIYALLVREPAIWEDLYTNAAGADQWGVKSVQSILATLGFSPGRMDGVIDDGVKNAIKKFQTSRKLQADGENTSSLRKELFTSYMDSLYGSEFAPLDKKEDFLALGKDKDLKGDVMGCGEFNPILLLSKSENEKLRKADRDEANAPNRRVMVFLFEPGTSVAPGTWPCPTAIEGPDGCKKRFFSDGEKRRAPGAERREHRNSHDTFACRFYDLMAGNSPCERPVKKRLPLQLVSTVRQTDKPPVLLVRDASGKELRKLQGEEIAGGGKGAVTHAFDLQEVLGEPAFSLQAVSEDNTLLMPEVSFNLPTFVASLIDPQALIRAFSLLFKVPDPAGKKIEGPEGPDLLNVNKKFDNPEVPENPPPKEDDTLGF